MTTTTEPPRWHHRFANYRRAFLLLREALDEEELTQLERERTIRRFEEALDRIRRRYLAAMDDLHVLLFGQLQGRPPER